MTEAEWLACEDPGRMLNLLTRGPGATPDNAAGLLAHRAGGRKLRLFACACCRAVWHLLADPRSRRAVEVAERYADGEAAENDIRLAWAACHSVATEANAGYFTPPWLGFFVTDTRPEHWPRSLSETIGVTAGGGLPPAAQAALLREVIGNPFRPALAIDGIFPQGRGPLTWHPYWRDVLTPVARAAYEERLPDGSLDPHRLAVLADALEDAGCDNEGVLRHLRGRERCVRIHDRPPVKQVVCRDCGNTGWRPLRGPHALGCWAVNCVLGKE